MAAGGGKDSDDQKGRWGNFLGKFGGGNGDVSSGPKSGTKNEAQGEESENAVMKFVSRRILQRSPKGDDGDAVERRAKGRKSTETKKEHRMEKKDGGKGVVVDMGTFVGPKFPVNSDVALTTTLERERVRQARAELQAKRKRQLEHQAKARETARMEAADRAKKVANELRRKEQREKERRELQEAVRKAASGQKNPDYSVGSIGNRQKANEAMGRSKLSGKEGADAGGGIVKSALSGAQNLWDSVFNRKNEGEEWIVVCTKTRVSPGEIVPVSAAGLDLLVVASRDGKKVHAIANSCPHLGTPLETGMLDRRLKPGVELEKGQDISKMPDGCFEDCIVCPLHNTAFELDSGEVRGEWCPHPPVIGKMMGAVKPKSNLPKFDIRLRGKNIEIRLNTSLE